MSYSCHIGLKGLLQNVTENIMLCCALIESLLGMGRLIAVHGIRGFKAHGSVHRRQFVYHGFYRF